MGSVSKHDYCAALLYCGPICPPPNLGLYKCLEFRVHGTISSVVVYVFMYEWPSYIARVRINRVRLPILLVVISISLSPFAAGNLVTRDRFGSPVPRQPAHLHTRAEYGVYLRDSSWVPRCLPFIYLNRHKPSGQCPNRITAILSVDPFPPLRLMPVQVYTA